MWRKWVFIASIGALTCLFRGTVGEIAAAPGGSEVGLAILGEAASVAAAAGHPLPPPDRGALIRLLTDPGSPMTSSLYRDLQAGRGTEVEQILGDLISRARALGVATAVLDLATLALRVHQQRIHNSPPPQQPRGDLAASQAAPARILRGNLGASSKSFARPQVAQPYRSPFRTRPTATIKRNQKSSYFCSKAGPPLR